MGAYRSDDPLDNSLYSVIHVITGLRDGGAEAVLFRLSTFDKCHSHIIISLGDMGKYGALLEAKGIRVECLEMPPGRVTLRGLGRLIAIIRNEQPQIVQTWMYHANLLGGVAARLSGVSDVYWNIRHSELVSGTTGGTTRLTDWICARLSHFVPAGIIACAKEAMRVHIAKGYDHRKFTIIPNGYDVSLFAPKPQARAVVRAELGISSTERVAGLVGRWHRQKDHANLIAALRLVKHSHPDLHIMLAGSQCDPSNAELTNLLRSAGLNERVHLLGGRADVPDLMNALDLHILSSSHGEGFPNVVAEAMACATPCVVTDVGDASLIVGDTGWVVPPENSQALAIAIDDALNEIDDVGQWTIRRNAARQRIVREFSLNIMAERYSAAWHCK